MLAEKEFDFFNKYSEPTQSQSRPTVLSLINDRCNIALFNDIFHIKASNALALFAFASGLISVFMAAVFATSKPNFLIFISTLGVSIFSVISLFRFMGGINQKEYNILSRRKFKPFAEDIDYVTDLFEKEYGIKVDIKFSDTWNASLDFYADIEGEKVNFYSLSLFTLEGSTPDVWFRRISWSYEGALEKQEAKKVSTMLAKIKEKDKDVWFSLCGTPDSAKIKSAYDKLFE